MVVAPQRILNWIGGAEVPADGGDWFDKVSPADGRVLHEVARSGDSDVARAVDAAERAQSEWSQMPGVERGERLHSLVRLMQDNRDVIAATVTQETGKSRKDALSETAAAISAGFFFAAEGQRMYGRTTTSGIANRRAMTIRQPVGLAGLIVPANTPIANIAWKVFPALVCGNTAILKAAEDAPATAWVFGRLARESALPRGVLNVIHGIGSEAGAALAAHQSIGVVSFTGSTAVGRMVQEAAASRFARVSLELGGKNPFVVCDDANLDEAVRWAVQSAFSNAGQRCASGSRIIVFESVYERFRARFVERTRNLRIGNADDDDLGPVINEKSLNRMISVIERAERTGATLITGGRRMTGPSHRDGFYLEPAVLEGPSAKDEISVTELFGPVTCLFKAAGFADALAMANDSAYGLTACIHTASIHRAMEFAERVKAGVAVVNAGTHGSEPHMPFGGVGLSGNGTREPGTEALDVYTNLKDIYITSDPALA